MKQFSFSKSALCIGLALGSTSAMAANSWLSRVNTESENYEAKVLVASQLQAVQQKSNSSAKAVFDITVSLHNNPEGSDQQQYEEILGNFADGICEQSNGEHKLGKVSIFRENKHRSKSDIIWGAREWPRANASGFGANGMHIWFGDVFPNGTGPGTDYDMLSNPVGAGYTLAHEWGHYAYGLFDEYKGNSATGISSRTLSTDIATDSIMSNQWQAVNGEMKWLNHSTASVIGNHSRTAQGRVYGKSAWEVLLQDTKNDPKSGRKTAQPNRTRFTTLANNAPDLATPLKEELPGLQATCREQLNFVWVEGDIDMQVVIDRSGSMSGSPINNAKQAAITLVDAVAEGTTAMGLVSFSSTATQDFPIQIIPNADTTVKPALKNTIDAIRSTGSTALFDGSQLALTNLNNYQNTSGSGAPGVVFLLADGDDNSSRFSESEVIVEYQQANVPIFSFGYGSASPTGPLLTLANSTGGKYFSSPTTLAEITDAFLQANAVATDNQNIVSSSMNIANGSSVVKEIHIDSGLDNINIFINHNGNPDEILLKLIDANDAEVSGIDFACTQVSSTQSCNVNIPNSIIASLGHGQWKLEVLNNQTNYPVDVTVNVIGEPSLQGSYTVSVEGFAGNAVTYPNPMILTTALTKDKLITGANVIATIIDPAQRETTLSMLDDGLAGDAVAGDGIYSAIAPYSLNGIHQVEVNVNNADSKAQYTSTGLLTPTLDGSEPEEEALPTIDENFVRITKTSLVVSDIPYSDGDDSYFYSTSLEADNTGIDGMIDLAGDVDFYVVENIDTTKDMVVRVSDFSLDMLPSLAIYKSDGLTIITEGITVVSNPSSTDYLYFKIASADLEAKIYVSVSHEDSAATFGGYIVSAGEPLNTDVPPNYAPEVNDDVTMVWVGQTVSISPLENDTDLDGDTLVIDSVDTSSLRGGVTLVGETLTYDPGSAFDSEAEGARLIDSLTYTVTDNKGAFVEGKIDITVKVNTSPDANPDSVSVDEDKTVTISPLLNDADADGHSFTLTNTQSPSDGVLVDNGDGSLTYDPNGQFSSLIKGETATELFTYSITDELGAVSTGDITINIVGINTAPEAIADVAETTKGADVQINLIANDSDADADDLSVIKIDSSELKGLVTNNDDGTVTYSPNGQFSELYQGESATEIFSYTVSDGEEEAAAQVTVTINGEGTKPIPDVEPEKEKSSGGSMSWLLLLLTPLVFNRRKPK
ncbi:Ig-like domain-containing protein [Shewanella sp. 10N.286.48.B5]|uniref:Ig-like domain-containing protein n=1 Tax=Shewanella sp. 10N.286.48.B5 TaxID=1880834 RepID=UPI000C850B7E|nr:tandem-95 repeat protein [Shewanella sp. 10N.286.48.B5]PMH85318.1 adhesin [Shewanella sp. 10N.286.48.B5]